MKHAGKKISEVDEKCLSRINIRATKPTDRSTDELWNFFVVVARERMLQNVFAKGGTERDREIE